MAFSDLYGHGMVRAAAAAPRPAVADPVANRDSILELARAADAAGVALCVFPELSLSSYALDDLHMQDALIARVEVELARLAAASAGLFPVLVVGAPVVAHGALYNCAVVMKAGRILGVVPKTYLPNYREFYEKRQFAAGDQARAGEVRLAGQTAPFGVGLLFEATDCADFIFHVEICEDLWAAIPPSTHGALAGATVLCNLSASNITIGKAAARDRLAEVQSNSCAAAYIYAAAAPGESTTDLAWDGQTMIYELGEKLGEGPRFSDEPVLTTADIDLERLRQERLRTPTFRDAVARNAAALDGFRRVTFALDRPADAAPVPLTRKVARFPYVPDDPTRLDADCSEAFHIQVQGLASRLRASGVQKAVIGVSGGLDSTHALLVTVKAFDDLKRPRTDIIALTMPGFATTDHTKSNAHKLMAALGVTARELDIRPAAQQMLADIGHPFHGGEAVYDVTFENVQAGLRTDYLFRIANHEGGLVVGTGDLSETALGWCTYGVGDHMSHYNVNASVSKTLIQHLIRWCAETEAYGAGTPEILASILDTEISPELVPPGADGAIQSTEDAIGPYALHDFALFYVTRYGLRPSKIAFLAEHAWGDAARGAWPPHLAAADKVAYSRGEIRKWLEVFVKRFFAFSQFKRSAMPNGPKTTTGGSLSPRGDWRAPSDASAKVWLDELAETDWEG